VQYPTVGYSTYAEIFYGNGDLHGTHELKEGKEEVSLRED
jgi:hypothetical protein